jgi:nucleoside-diphosphate-sugar epimerase
MEGADGIFHLAARYELGISDPSRMEQINIGGTRNVLEVMQELAIPKGVYTSTLAVFSDTNGRIVDESYRVDGASEQWASHYDRTKWEAHYHVALPMMEAGLPLVIAMPGLVYGPGDQSAFGQTVRLYLQRRLFAIPSGAAFTWGHVEDVAHGHILAMERGITGESYIIAGPVHPMKEMFALAESITGIPAPALELPRYLFHASARVAGLFDRFLPLPQIFTAEGLRSAAGTYTATNAKARAELGYDPRPLEEGLRETLLHEMHSLGLAPITPPG